jgi:hypothetical protein
VEETTAPSSTDSSQVRSKRRRPPLP